MTVDPDSGEKHFFVQAHDRPDEPKEERKRPPLRKILPVRRWRNPRLVTPYNIGILWWGIIFLPLGSQQSTMHTAGWLYFIQAKAAFRFAEEQLIMLQREDHEQSEREQQRRKRAS